MHTTLTGNTPSHLAASEIFEGSMVGNGNGEAHLKGTDAKNSNVSWLGVLKIGHFEWNLVFFIFWTASKSNLISSNR